MVQPKLFRDIEGNPKEMLSFEEGIAFKESPLDFFILLARYKFASRFIKKGHKVLDMGCGKGYGSVFLASTALEVVGGDYDQDLLALNNIEHASTKNLRFEHIDLLDPEKSLLEKFDVVVSMDVIEHFEKDSISLAASNYAKFLKPGGFAIIGTPNVASRPFASERRLASHPFEFDAQGFEGELSNHFRNVFLFSMTDEVVSTSFPGLSWYLMALCTK
jgi:2-polyprenyl-3-methyl-5-hydroxy-6-metoxy-1,4-benzoquinol methylase